ncbi:MAG: DMT family transporter [Microscillaceae bacterium]|jgi:drug/metabolite transporter (DMT)-like permease|nr:DMT family transporter [Microscillaceae bacterium]
MSVVQTPTRFGQTWLGVVLVAAGAVGFASKAVLAKLMYRYGLEAMPVLTLRMFFSLPFFLILIYWYSDNAKLRTVQKKDILWLVVLGFSGYYLSSLLDFIGLQYISAGLERLILFTYPTIIILASAIFLKKPIQNRQIYALLLTYLGIFLAMREDIGIKNENFLLGALFVFGSACTYSFFLMGSERIIPKFGSITYSAWAMLIATFFMFLHYLIASRVDLWHFPSEVYGLSLLMALIATVIPIVLTVEGIRLLGAGNMAIVGNIGPISTILLAYIFLNEPITLWQIVGTGFVLAGIGLIGAKKG